MMTWGGRDEETKNVPFKINWLLPGHQLVRGSSGKQPTTDVAGGRTKFLCLAVELEKVAWGVDDESRPALLPLMSALLSARFIFTGVFFDHPWELNNITA
jgi:hypothetical protein